jgi:hypothetical protein
MLGCITSLSCISTDSIQSEEYGHTVARGHDVRSLVYAFLDEWLFNFHDTGFVPKEISMEYDASIYSVVSWGYGEGEVLDLSRPLVPKICTKFALSRALRSECTKRGVFGGKIFTGLEGFLCTNRALTGCMFTHRALTSRSTCTYYDFPRLTTTNLK